MSESEPMRKILYYENLIEYKENSKTPLHHHEVALEKLCRTCLCNADSKSLEDRLLCVVGMDGKILQVLDMLAVTTGVEIDLNDRLPVKICYACMNKLSAAYFFKTQISRAEKTLKNLLKKLDFDKKFADIINTEKEECIVSSKKEYKNQNNLTAANNSDSEAPTQAKENSHESISFSDNENRSSILTKDNGEIFDEVEQLDSDFSEEIVEILSEELMEEINSGDSVVDIQEKKIYQVSEKQLTYLSPKERTKTTKKFKSISKSNQVACQICKIEFHLQRDLISHTKSDHPEEKAFKCHECSATFRHLQSMHRHLKLHQSGKKDKMCALCCKMFIRADDLKRHIRTHTNERPYVCGTCGKGFKQTSELKEHILSHSKAKIFKCDLCGRELASRNGMYIHMKVHKKIKEHLCHLCNKAFVTKSELKSHMKVHNGNPTKRKNVNT